MQNNKNETKPLNYIELRKTIHSILSLFCAREIECSEGKEYDWEFQEWAADQIIALIYHQGGTTNAE